jgi:hypothetical protein
VTYDSVENLQKGEVTELPSHVPAYEHIPKAFLQAFFSKFGLYIAKGLLDLPQENSLNKKFPDIKPLTVKEVLEFWKN